MSQWNIKVWQKELNLEQTGEFDGPTLAASRRAAGFEAWKPRENGTEGMELAPPNIGDYVWTPPERFVNELIWHCAATPEGKWITVEDIDRWHRQRDFAEIGYHAVVYLDGTIHHGRSIEKQGAHTKDHGKNRNTLGFCYIGGVTTNGQLAKDTRTPDQRASMLWLTQQVIKDPRIKQVSGHNQYANKACPSFDVRKDELGNLPGFQYGTRN